MAKLVVVMADNTAIDVPLDRERITIGRRPDNDVCLPYPAVSGEHAAVVTILADSFLEDLGSTNGTLVNGKPVAKHFLRDRDQIDVGKQRLVYLARDDERYEPPSHALGPLNMRMLAERVDPIQPPIIRSNTTEPSRSVDPAISQLSDDLDSGISGMQVSAEIDSMAGIEPEPVHRLPPHHVSALHATPARRAERPAPTPPNPELTQSLPPMPAIKVLTGPNAGRSVPLLKDETTVGRVGVAVAAIRRSGDAFTLVPLEARDPAKVNGRPVGKDAVPLRPDDEIEIAGTKLKLVVPGKP